jgi:hypothetical protein
MNFHETFRRDNDMHMIGLLASGVAHDLNNRLQSIASALSLIRVRVAAGVRLTSILSQKLQNGH